VKATHGLEAMLARIVAASLGRRSWPGALAAGAGMGDLARRVGLRRRVAEDNLRIAFPEQTPEFRDAVLRAHYRELGRVAAEYPRLGALVKAGAGEVVAGATGLEHLDAARSLGRGVILLTGHYGHFELLGAWLGRRHPLDFVVKPLSNPSVEAMLAGWRAEAGVGTIPLGAGMRRVFEALRANRWVAMVADQDARDHGTFVPFFGRPSSTPKGPAELALRTGAPLIMGFAHRQEDGRHALEIAPPLAISDPRAPNAVAALTACHTALLEAEVRKRPEAWFWLHRRWKTTPPVETAAVLRSA
jgi:KDO2-lipid IV(A) lauroyltransferase